MVDLSTFYLKEAHHTDMCDPGMVIEVTSFLKWDEVLKNTARVAVCWKIERTGLQSLADRCAPNESNRCRSSSAFCTLALGHFSLNQVADQTPRALHEG